MKRFFQRALLLIAVMTTTATTVMAQQMPPIPVDSAVRIGKLDNGLTYYIRHNETPKGQADFYIAQKVGSILEEDNQRGLAHFLEHMCFNGTENFPGKKLIEWLESVGVKFGYNLNAYTSVDRTVYNISNVPVARQSVQDSCLLILHDWADALTLDPAEIDNERGVIHEEWRRSMVGNMRIIENLLPTIYPNGNQYAHRLPIGIMEVVDNFPHQALRDYYETWYRPDQQGIIVVGDIDPDYIEGKIKEMFGPIKMPENPKERVYYPVEDNEGTIFAIGKDKEQTMGIVQMMFKMDPPVPEAEKSNSQYLLVKYMFDMIETMLDNRLTEIGKKPDAPFAQAGAQYGDFLLAKTKNSFDIIGVAKGDDVRPAFESVYRELLRAVRGGFTIGEYERARAEYLSRLERAYESRNMTESEQYVHQYVEHFLDNEPIPSIDDEYEFIKQIAPMLPVEYINGLLSEIITNDNRVVIVMTPDNDTFHFPTQEELQAVIAGVDAEDIEPYKDEMKSEPLIPALPAPGKVVSNTDNAQWNAKELTLSNGVKVIVKPTKFKDNEIVFYAMAKGGTSAISDDHAADLQFLPYSSRQHGLGTYTNSDLQKYLQGKQAHVNTSFDEYHRSLEGSSTVKDLPTLMELIYMTFADYTITEDDFASMKNLVNGFLANQEASPEYIFQKNLMKSIYESAVNQAISSASVNAADLDGTLGIIHSMLDNAADYTFAFVGDIDMDTFIPLAEQYLATLPADASKKVEKVEWNLSREIRPGTATDTFTTAMETPQTWVFIAIEGKLPYTPANKTLTSIASQILSKRLLDKIREEMGATYSIHAQGSMQRVSEYPIIFQIPFPMKPEMKAEALTAIDTIIKGMESDITADELNPIKEYMVKNATESLEKNEDWAGAITATTLNDVDTFNTAIDTINAITVEDVQNFMRELLGQGNYRTVILDPETVQDK